MTPGDADQFLHPGPARREATTFSSREMHHHLIQRERPPVLRQSLGAEVDAGVDADWNVELDAFRVERVEFLIVDRDAVLEALEVEAA